MTLLDPFLASLTTENGIQTRITNPPAWTTPRAPVIGFIDEHLAGGRSIGLRGADQIQYLMIDIDCHNGEPIQGKLDLLLKAFPGSSLPFRSSDSNGIHFYIFLDEMTPRTQAREALKNKLISINYPDAERVEIFPWSSRAHRLPFGIGNRPMPGGKDTLASETQADQQSYFSKWFKNELRPYNVAELLKYASISEYYYKPITGQRQAQHTDQDNAPTNPEQLRGRPFYSDPVHGIDTLLSQGITTQGMRYQATNALTFYYIQNKELSKAETVREITTWLNEKHNGKSACYNSNRPKAYKDIQDIVNNYDPSKLSPEKAHKRTPQNAVKPIHFANDEQRHFAQVIQRIAHKYGRKTTSGGITAGLGYELIMQDFRFSNRNKVARCFRWAKASGLLTLKKVGYPGLGVSAYKVSPDLLYGRHGKPAINKRQKLADLVQEHGTQKAVAELLGVSLPMLSMILSEKKPIPAAWFEPRLISRVNQIDTLLSINLFLEPATKEKKEKGLIPGGIAFESGKSENPRPGLVGFDCKTIANNRGNYAIQTE